MSTSVKASADEGLVRGITRWDFLALIVNITIGAGILGLPSKIYNLVGTYSLWAYIVSASVVTLIILCFAEVSSRFTGTGGPYLYAREAFGPLVGFEVGWLMWLSRMASFASICNLFVSYAAYFIPAIGHSWGRIATIVSLITMLTCINLLGVRTASRVNTIVTVSKVLVLVLFTAFGLFYIDPHAFSFGALPDYSSFSVSVMLLIFTFSGFDVAAIPSGEVQQPQRTIPFALFMGIAIVALLFWLVQVVCIGTLPNLATSERPLADAAQQFIGPGGASCIAMAALVIALGTLNALMLTGPRLLFAIAEQGQLPGIVAATHPRFRTPHVAILISAAVKLILAISGTFIYALTLSTLIRLFYFALTSAALPVLRYRQPGKPAVFYLKAGWILSILSTLLCIWLISNSRGQEARDVGIAALVGLLIYGIYRRVAKGLKLSLNPDRRK